MSRCQSKRDFVLAWQQSVGVEFLEMCGILKKIKTHLKSGIELAKKSHKRKKDFNQTS